jgi:secretion/DNA translocation related TadE-like protein
LAVALIAALASALIALTTVAAALAARQRAAAAADLAALAGAQSLIDGQELEQACQLADQVAQSNGAELATCSRAPLDGLAVTCRVGVVLPVFGPRQAVGSAVAGPP